MEQTESGFYVVNVLPLKTPSGKPKYIAKRDLKSKKLHHSKNRTDFLDNRKTKLHDRDVHVQKVVQQHRLQLNGESSAKSQKISESSKIAEENRSKLILLQVAHAKDKVLHAKKIAQKNRTRIQLESNQRKARLESRQQRVAFRRQNLLSVPRSRLLDLQDWSIEELQDLQSTLQESATSIQLWWTQKKLSPALQLFRDTNVSFDHATALDFPLLIEEMQQKQVIAAGSAVIERIKFMSSNSSSWKNPARVFLSAYMIATHPHDSMPHYGRNEENLQRYAEEMIKDFEKLIKDAHGRKVRQLVRKFIRSLDRYFSEFEEWKANDTRKIVDAMISHWYAFLDSSKNRLELEKLWLSVRHSQNDADTNWHPKISEQQKSILEKISKFGPDAMKRLKRKQKLLVEELQIAEEMNPQLAALESDDAASSSAYESDSAPSAIYSTSPERFPLNAFMTTQDSVKMTRRSSSQASSHTSRQSMTSSAMSTPALAPITFPKESPKILPSPVAYPTDLGAPSSAMASAAQAFGSYLSNEQLAFELIRNPNFELKPNKKSKLEEQVSKMALKAFFDNAREQFSKGIFINFVPSLLEDIKSQLLGMVSSKGRIYSEINESLDIVLIRQQIEHKTFGGEQCTAYIISKMTQLCAPVRDQSIRDISKLPDLASMFEKCLEILQGMKLDLINYKLKSLAPVLKAQAVEYETGKFKDAVDSGKLQLTRTKEWLISAHTTLETIALARNPENILHPENKIRFEDVYNEALMNIIFSPSVLVPDKVPESLVLDAQYLFKLQNEAQLITIVAAIVMLSKNAVPTLRRDFASVKVLRDRLFTLLKDDEDNHDQPQITVENLSQEVIRVCNSALTQSNAAGMSAQQQDVALPSATEQLITSMVERTISTKDALYSMISRRVQGLCRGQLNTGVFKSVTGGSLSSSGLDIVEAELKDLSQKVYQLALHNKEVHAQWYDEILKEVIRK